MRIGKRYLILSMALIATMYGCAFGTRHVTLNPVKTSLGLDAVGQSVYVEVTDKRNPALKPVVGHVKNGYGMKTADVIGDKEVAVWVQDSILEELRRFGTVIITDPATVDAKASRLAIDVLICYAQAYWNYGGEVSVALTVRKDDRELINDKNYSGTARLGMNFAATSESYQKVLELAMDAMLQQILPDIITAITTEQPPRASQPKSEVVTEVSQPKP